MNHHGSEPAFNTVCGHKFIPAACQQMICACLTKRGMINQLTIPCREGHGPLFYKETYDSGGNPGDTNRTDAAFAIRAGVEAVLLSLLKAGSRPG